MKRIFSYILLATSLLCGSQTLVSCSDDDDMTVEETPVTIKDLPSSAQTFLNQYFEGYTVYKIDRLGEDNQYLYDVYLEKGYEVVFNSDGLWVEVEAPTGMTIPDGIVPEVVMESLKINYPDYGVNEIQRTGSGYSVELTNGQGGDGIKIFFNEAGQQIGITNDY